MDRIVAIPRSLSRESQHDRRCYCVVRNKTFCDLPASLWTQRCGVHLDELKLPDQPHLHYESYGTLTDISRGLQTRMFLRFRSLRRSKLALGSLLDAYLRPFAGEIDEEDLETSTYVLECVPSIGSKQLKAIYFIDRHSRTTRENDRDLVLSLSHVRGNVRLRAESPADYAAWVSIVSGASTHLHVCPVDRLHRSCLRHVNIEQTRSIVARLERLGFPLDTTNFRGESALYVAARCSAPVGPRRRAA